MDVLSDTKASLVKAETQRGASFMDLFLVVDPTVVGGGGKGIYFSSGPVEIGKNRWLLGQEYKFHVSGSAIVSREIRWISWIQLESMEHDCRL